MGVAPSIVPSGGPGGYGLPRFHFGTTYGEVPGSPYRSLTWATTRRVAVGSDRLHEGETACQYTVFAALGLGKTRCQGYVFGERRELLRH